MRTPRLERRRASMGSRHRAIHFSMDWRWEYKCPIGTIQAPLSQVKDSAPLSLLALMGFEGRRSQFVQLPSPSPDSDKLWHVRQRRMCTQTSIGSALLVVLTSLCMDAGDEVPHSKEFWRCHLVSGNMTMDPVSVARSAAGESSLTYHHEQRKAEKSRIEPPKAAPA